ncbi:transporter substrate-binding domain-containing protein [Clostridium swellfunianum]|uniref:transporter substrate-binding domain-containing protein n=1 Tax=Clostridium swellfunianum TaxID=1367462 RepID=UPI00202FEA34|nr:transporter substrate-binding domain-containing protein [Clostridium swellfunianum]MCM0647810.1 transporter substrate-binding domain-containing protein [Clostridium swellfunianum]
MKKRYTKLVALLLTGVLTLSLSACGKKETTIDKIKKNGKIVLGTSPDYPPYEFINSNKEVVGFDIEIAKEIAKDLGVKLEIKDMEFKGLLPALQAGSVDFVLAGMTPDEERKQSVDFSKVYYTAVQNIVVRAEDKDKIKSTDDLKGKKLGVQKGTIQEDIAKEQVPGAEAKALGKITDLVLAVKTKNMDAAIIEGPVAKAYTNANKDIVIADIKLKTEEAGSAVAVKKGNEELVSTINKTLDKLATNKTIETWVNKANEDADKLAE